MPGGINPPPSVIASWPKPNYVDPETEGPALMIVGIVFGGIAILLVSARMYSRYSITRTPEIDDLLVTISLVFSIALTVFVIVGNKEYGWGRHIWDVSPTKFAGIRLILWISQWLYLTATCSVKISVLLFYRRLSSNLNRFFFIATWIGIAYNIGYYVSFIVALSFACRPTQAYWLAFNLQWAATHKFTCVNEHLSLPMSAGLSVFGDFYSTLIPCILILRLNLPKRQKLALYSLFFLGFLVVAAGVIRAVYINYLINETYDNTWLLWKFWLWTLIELYTSIAAASAPALKPFFGRYLMDPITSRQGNSCGYARDGQDPSNGRKELGSNVSSIIRFDNNIDIEKISMSLHGDETRRYELRTLPSGKVEPVQVIVGEEKSI